MKLNNKRIFFIIIAVAIFIIPTIQASASTGTPLIDTDGSVTGKVGATYYNVNTWTDMFDTYKNVTPDQTSNSTVFLNITGDVPGNSIITTGARITSGKSICIIGNGHTLYFDNDTNYTTGVDAGNSGNVGFYAFGTVSNQTNATIKNVTWVNNRSSGIFPISGANAQVNTYYENINEYNGDGVYGASPIINEGGKIYFSGKNSFKVLKGLGMTSTDTSADSQFEWIRGGQYIEVLNGTTDVALNASQDQFIYPNGQGSGQTLKINDNSTLNWNLGNYYSLYYGSATAAPLTWTIGKNSKFNIVDSGKSQTSRWFDSTNFNRWIVNVDTNGELTANTAGGSINLDAFNGIVTWDFGQYSDLFLNNRSNNNLFTGVARTGSSINFNDVNKVTLLAKSSPVFSSNSNIPINISGGEGLRLHASSTLPIDINNISDTTNFSGNDIWKRVSTGSTNGGFSSATMAPNNYSSSDLVYMKASKFMRWYKPTGIAVSSSSINRNFTLNLNNLPQDGSFGSTISGDDTMSMNFTDDRGQNPNFSVQLSQVTNLTGNSTQYVWQNPGNTTPVTISSEPVVVATLNNDNVLPSNVTMTMAGGNYNFSYAKNEGLLLKANNKLKTQNKKLNAVMRYAIVSGP